MKIFNRLIVFVFLFFLVACSSNKEKKDTSELWSKSMATQDILKRSGTIFTSPEARDSGLAERDAKTRLQSGGGLFGKKGLSLNMGGQKNDSVANLGMPINPYLWRASLESINFIPLSSADPFAGIIITEWYNDGTSLDERCKINVFIKGVELTTNNLKASIFCQQLTSNNWIDKKVDNEKNISLENAILEKAIKARLSSQ